VRSVRFLQREGREESGLRSTFLGHDKKPPGHFERPEKKEIKDTSGYPPRTTAKERLSPSTKSRVGRLKHVQVLPKPRFEPPGRTLIQKLCARTSKKLRMERGAIFSVQTAGTESCGGGDPRQGIKKPKPWPNLRDSPGRSELPPSR